MSGKVYGYVRVSTKNQNEVRQLIAMREFIPAGGKEPWRFLPDLSAVGKGTAIRQ